MSKNITLFGQDFSNVPALNVPLQGGGSGKFIDVSDTDAVATDVASGKYFYTADGTKTEGSASGGGGTSDFSVAMVTFIDTNEEGYAVFAPFVLEGDEYIEQGGMLPGGVTPASSIYPSYFTDTFTDSVRVALYKNSAYISIDGSIVSVSGNASILDAPANTRVQITGDCTITVS